MHVAPLPLDLIDLMQDLMDQKGGANFHALSLSLSSPNSALSQQEEAIAPMSHLYASSRGQTMSARLVFDALHAASLA